MFSQLIITCFVQERKKNFKKRLYGIIFPNVLSSIYLEKNFDGAQEGKIPIFIYLI